jgi:hypothetical protein
VTQQGYGTGVPAKGRGKGPTGLYERWLICIEQPGQCTRCFAPVRYKAGASVFKRRAKAYTAGNYRSHPARSSDYNGMAKVFLFGEQERGVPAPYNLRELYLLDVPEKLDTPSKQWGVFDTPFQLGFEGGIVCGACKFQA